MNMCLTRNDQSVVHWKYANNLPIEWINGCCHKASEGLIIATADTMAQWYRDFYPVDSDDIVVVERFPWSL